MSALVFLQTTKRIESWDDFERTFWIFRAQKTHAGQLRGAASRAEERFKRAGVQRALDAWRVAASTLERLQAWPGLTRVEIDFRLADERRDLGRCWELLCDDLRALPPDTRRPVALEPLGEAFRGAVPANNAKPAARRTRRDA